MNSPEHFPQQAPREPIPEGWQTFDMPDTFIDYVGPFYRKREPGGMRLGLRIEQRHCNKLPFAHGGMLSAMCDVLISFCAAKASKSTSGGVTASMNVDFLGAAKKGAWLEGYATPRRVGRQLVFVDCVLTADGKEAVRATGIWKVGRPESIPTA
jgi:acyl-coenzyme A thioesterase 13